MLSLKIQLYLLCLWILRPIRRGVPCAVIKFRLRLPMSGGLWLRVPVTRAQHSTLLALGFLRDMPPRNRC